MDLRQTVRKSVALGCVLASLMSFTGCQALVEYVDNYVPPTTPFDQHTTPPVTDPVPGETPAETEPPHQPTLTGVVTAKSLNIRQGPGLEYDVIGSLEQGTKVAIYEQQVVGKSTWGRIKSGWVSMGYITLENPNNSEITITHSIIATVTIESLNMREGPGTRYDRVDQLTTGNKVQITEICVVGNILWGKAKKGWVCMSYVSIDGTPNGEFRLSGTVNIDSLTIRAEAGSKYQALGNYSKNDKIVISQLVSVNDVPWGKTDKGWICMNYVIPDGDIKVTAD